eukprot:gene5950-4259_t
MSLRPTDILYLRVQNTPFQSTKNKIKIYYHLLLMRVETDDLTCCRSDTTTAFLRPHRHQLREERNELNEVEDHARQLLLQMIDRGMETMNNKRLKPHRPLSPQDYHTEADKKKGLRPIHNLIGISAELMQQFPPSKRGHTPVKRLQRGVQPTQLNRLETSPYPSPNLPQVGGIESRYVGQFKDRVRFAAVSSGAAMTSRGQQRHAPPEEEERFFDASPLDEVHLLSAHYAASFGSRSTTRREREREEHVRSSQNSASRPATPHLLSNRSSNRQRPASAPHHPVEEESNGGFSDFFLMELNHLGVDEKTILRSLRRIRKRADAHPQRSPPSTTPSPPFQLPHPHFSLAVTHTVSSPRAAVEAPPPPADPKINVHAMEAYYMGQLEGIYLMEKDIRLYRLKKECSSFSKIERDQLIALEAVHRSFVENESERCSPYTTNTFYYIAGDLLCRTAVNAQRDIQDDEHRCRLAIVAEAYFSQQQTIKQIIEYQGRQIQKLQFDLHVALTSHPIPIPTSPNEEKIYFPPHDSHVTSTSTLSETPLPLVDNLSVPTKSIPATQAQINCIYGLPPETHQADGPQGTTQKEKEWHVDVFIPPSDSENESESNNETEDSPSPQQPTTSAAQGSHAMPPSVGSISTIPAENSHQRSPMREETAKPLERSPDSARRTQEPTQCLSLSGHQKNSAAHPPATPAPVQEASQIPSVMSPLDHPPVQEASQIPSVMSPLDHPPVQEASQIPSVMSPLDHPPVQEASQMPSVMSPLDHPPVQEASQMPSVMSPLDHPPVQEASQIPSVMSPLDHPPVQEASQMPSVMSPLDHPPVQEASQMPSVMSPLDHPPVQEASQIPSVMSPLDHPPVQEASQIPSVMSPLDHPPVQEASQMPSVMSPLDHPPVQEASQMPSVMSPLDHPPVQEASQIPSVMSPLDHPPVQEASQMPSVMSPLDHHGGASSTSTSGLVPEAGASTIRRCLDLAATRRPNEIVPNHEEVTPSLDHPPVQEASQMPSVMSPLDHPPVQEASQIPSVMSPLDHPPVQEASQMPSVMSPLDHPPVQEASQMPSVMSPLDHPPVQEASQIPSVMSPLDHPPVQEASQMPSVMSPLDHPPVQEASQMPSVMSPLDHPPVQEASQIPSVMSPLNEVEVPGVGVGPAAIRASSSGTGSLTVLHGACGEVQEVAPETPEMAAKSFPIPSAPRMVGRVPTFAALHKRVSSCESGKNVVGFGVAADELTLGACSALSTCDPEEEETAARGLLDTPTRIIREISNFTFICRNIYIYALLLFERRWVEVYRKVRLLSIACDLSLACIEMEKALKCVAAVGVESLWRATLKGFAVKGFAFLIYLVSLFIICLVPGLYPALSVTSSMASSIDMRTLIWAGIAIRLVLLLYSMFHDYYFRVKYTDIDYMIIVDGASEMVRGGSPFDRTTYRYTPLLAGLVIPAAVVANPLGKLVFVASDIGAAMYCYSVLRTYATKSSAKWMVSLFILFNPIVLNVSTRGNSDMLITFMSMFVLSKFLDRKYFQAAAMLGFAVHFKIYPIIYALPLVLGLWEMSTEKSVVSRCLSTLGQGFLLGLMCIVSFAIPTFLCYLAYGDQYIDEAFLYHMRREDHRHNFSPYWLLMYLNMGRRALGTGVDYSAGLFAFIPQFIVLFFTAWKLRRNVPHACCVMTVLFIAFNKVCTVQYFVWFIPFLSFIFCEPLEEAAGGKKNAARSGKGCQRPSLWEITTVMTLWSLTIPAWVITAMPLEFEGKNRFGRLWVVSCVFFLATVGLQRVSLLRLSPLFISLFLCFVPAPHIFYSYRY